MTATLQPKPARPMPTEARARPMMPLRGVASLLRKDPAAVVAMAEEGHLRWAWDVALVAGSRRKIHFLPACVDDCVAGVPCQLAFEDVVALLLSSREESILGVEVYWALNVDGAHFYNLLQRGEFTACSAYKHGPTGSVHVTVESFISFLRRRCWPFPVGDP